MPFPLAFSLNFAAKKVDKAVSRWEKNMKNEKYKKLYFALHNAELRLSVAMRRVQIVQEWIDDTEEYDYLEELDELELLYEIYRAIDRTLEANGALNASTSHLIDLMHEQRLEGKYHD